MVPSAVRQVMVISTSGSATALVVTSTWTKVCPLVVKWYACRKLSVSTAAVPAAFGLSPMRARCCATRTLSR